MKAVFGGRLMAGLALGLALSAFAPICAAQRAAHPDEYAQKADKKQDKHARKIAKKLSRFKTGSYLQLVMNDNSGRFGTLGALSETSFAFNNSDTNASETHLYRDISEVKKGRRYVDEGAERHHHIHVF